LTTCGGNLESGDSPISGIDLPDAYAIAPVGSGDNVGAAGKCIGITGGAVVCRNTAVIQLGQGFLHSGVGQMHRGAHRGCPPEKESIGKSQ